MHLATAEWQRKTRKMIQVGGLGVARVESSRVESARSVSSPIAVSECMFLVYPTSVETKWVEAEVN